MNVLKVTSKFKKQNISIKHLESLKWPIGAFCPYCASSQSCAKTKEKRYTCISCKSSYSVTVGTIFEYSKLPLPK
jgi:transposase-like protein